MQKKCLKFQNCKIDSFWEKCFFRKLLKKQEADADADAYERVNAIALPTVRKVELKAIVHITPEPSYNDIIYYVIPRWWNYKTTMVKTRNKDD